MHEKSVADLDIAALTRDVSFHPSPEAWEDQILYFLLVDRFSDAKEKHYRNLAGELVREGKTAPYTPKDAGNAVKTEAVAAKWREAGDGWVGGTLKGLTAKLGYLKRLGITAVWVSPILKQCAFSGSSYHGYGTQNFLEIDPHFGTREDFKKLVESAHELGIYVLLDVIVNHAGDVFAYDLPENEVAFWNGNEYPVKAFRDGKGMPSLPFGPVKEKKGSKGWSEAAVWPTELQDPSAFTRKGEMRDWENCPEFVEGDFFALKDLNLGDYEDDKFVASPTLKALCECYKFWIAYADLDGFRLDTLKNMGLGAARYFTNEMHHFAKSLGKKNFLITAEVAVGAPDAPELMTRSGIDAAQSIGELPLKLKDVVSGHINPADFFGLFYSGPSEHNAPFWARDRIVTLFDDHDQVGKNVKGRLAATYPDDRARAEAVVVRALGMLLTTAGIPCVYYGSEQAFDGRALDEKGDNRYVREAMFGGGFGAFRTKDRHCFNEESRVYQELAKIAAIRRERPSLCRGKQFLREISEEGEHFFYPQVDAEGNYRGIIAWSRIYNHHETLMAMNTDPDRPRSLWVTVDAERRPYGKHKMRCVYSTDAEQVGTEINPPEARNGSAVCLTVPPGGFVIYE